MNALPQTGTTHVLHFADLSPRDFERLCFWLLAREEFSDLDHIGASGSDFGCDVSAHKDGRKWVCQCKRVSKFGPSDAEAEIDRILSCSEITPPESILLITTCDISAETRLRAIKRAGGVRCEFWPLTVLDERVKRHEDLLVEFFQLPQPVLDPHSREYGFALKDYLDAIEKTVDDEQIEELFVPLMGEYEHLGYRQHVDVLTFLDEWLARQQNKHLAILGEYGTGKTWLCLWLTEKLANAFRKGSGDSRLPVFLSFKSYKSGMDLHELIPATMARNYGIASCDAFKVIQSLRAGKTILILDGLDEMARELGQRDALVQFARLGIPPEATTIVTCRTHYFLSGNEQREVLNPNVPAFLANAAVKFDTLHLKLFDQSSIRDAIRRRAKKGMESHVINFVRSTYNLQELCARPVLLSLVCQSFEGLKSIEGEITSADLYEAYLEVWLTRDIQSGRLSIAPMIVLNMVQRLAEEMIRRDSLWLSAHDFKRLLSQFGREVGLNEMNEQNLVRQLATCTFLRRVGEDGWEFVHRSFQEYLYARRFFRWELESKDHANFAVTHVPTWQFISQIVLREWNEEKAEHWIVERVSRKQDRGLCKTTLRAAAAYWLLRRGLRLAREYSLRGIMLDWVDLRNVNLSGADMTGCDLNSSDLRGAKLQGTILRDSVLVSTDFSGSDLGGADLRGSNCRGARFHGANTSNVLWDGARGGPLDWKHSLSEEDY